MRDLTTLLPSITHDKPRILSQRHLLPGYLLLYPKWSDVEFLGDSESKLKKYFFGQKRKPHLFCGECSSNVMIDFAASEGEEEKLLLAVNVSSVSLESQKVPRPSLINSTDQIEYSTTEERGSCI